MKYLIAILLCSLTIGELYASGNIKIFSALGDPLIAEVQLLPDEGQKSEFSIEVKSESASQFKVERVGERGTLLLLSDQPIEQPILTLGLLSGEGAGKTRRQLTLFLVPVPPDSSSAYLVQLLNERNMALQQSGEMAAQQQESRSHWLYRARELFSVPTYQIFSSWTIFLLLGGGIALLLIRWWRFAEPVTDADLLQSGVRTETEDADIWGDFRRGVEQIERKIRPKTPGDGGV